MVVGRPQLGQQKTAMHVEAKPAPRARLTALRSAAREVDETRPDDGAPTTAIKLARIHPDTGVVNVGGIVLSGLEDPFPLLRPVLKMGAGRALVISGTMAVVMAGLEAVAPPVLLHLSCSDAAWAGTFVVIGQSGFLFLDAVRISHDGSLLDPFAVTLLPPDPPDMQLTEIASGGDRLLVVGRSGGKVVEALLSLDGALLKQFDPVSQFETTFDSAPVAFDGTRFMVARSLSDGVSIMTVAVEGKLDAPEKQSLMGYSSRSPAIASDCTGNALVGFSLWVASGAESVETGFVLPVHAPYAGTSAFGCEEPPPNVSPSWVGNGGAAPIDNLGAGGFPGSGGNVHPAGRAGTGGGGQSGAPASPIATPEASADGGGCNMAGGRNDEAWLLVGVLSLTLGRRRPRRTRGERQLQT
jgi:hypothetical protein